MSAQPCGCNLELLTGPHYCARHQFIDIVFEGDGLHDARLIEVEDHTRKSIKVGEWLKRDDGYLVLRIPRNMGNG